VRDRVRVSPDAESAVVIAAAKGLPKIQEALKTQNILKEIHVPGRMVSFVTRPVEAGRA
jgi:leucyl-tRNA synthetase